MQLLATLGYAVIYPDTPTKKGQPMADIAASAMGAADAAIAQGYADPDRLAVMGQSDGAYSMPSTIPQRQREFFNFCCCLSIGLRAYRPTKTLTVKFLLSGRHSCAIRAGWPL
jgi:hypothetical protein